MLSLNRLTGAVSSAALVLAASLPVLAQNITVNVNGQNMAFDQPPVMRSNRVFVPMRAIFERLGSTVVYSNGVINAQGNGRAVHLQIGSTDASINGNHFAMDVAPFTVAGRTEVPLRFVAQALGAGVNWDSNASTVYIKTSGGAPSENITPQPNESFHLTDQSPASGATVTNTHPAIHATFSEPVNRDSLRVSIDGRDVTPQVYANTNGFNVTANFELTPGQHRVATSGTTAAGATFNTGWSFSTSAGAAPNFISGVFPSAGSKVSSQFTLKGHTQGGSHVHVVATGSASELGGLLQIGTGTFQTDVAADSNGSFSAPIALNAVSGGQVRVIITSTAPDGSSIEQNIVYSS